MTVSAARVLAHRVLSLIPPMTQLNTPYPSAPYLTGFLRSRGVDAVQEDLALALVLRLLSRDGLARIIDLVQAQFDADPDRLFSPAVQSFMGQREQYLVTVNRVVAFLQGKDSTASHRIVSRGNLQRRHIR